ncbi:uncharacterized protein K441DRAFT_165022 [Cenococcum geophilum 1.58]|uniref:uncharacterized protein n=1 Tax=Cenococcum geophilum 1.58 TaxID=794803 RepID=UPI00358FBC8D|nr:hypothetical protein K441DRAFT_165022 [Cenococcum geophilum 1.58]
MPWTPSSPLLLLNKEANADARGRAGDVAHIPRLGDAAGEEEGDGVAGYGVSEAITGCEGDGGGWGCGWEGAWEGTWAVGSGGSEGRRSGAGARTGCRCRMGGLLGMGGWRCCWGRMRDRWETGCR